LRNWRALGLATEPAKTDIPGLGSSISFAYEHPRSSSKLPYWRVRFYTGLRLPVAVPPSAASEIILGHFDDIEVVFYDSACPPCQPQSQCSCKSTEVLRSKLGPDDFILGAPEARAFDDGPMVELRLIATVRRRDDRWQALQAKAEALAKEMGIDRGVALESTMSNFGTRIFDAVTGEELSHLRNRASYPVQQQPLDAALPNPV